jgi:hypothetical protein
VTAATAGIVMLAFHTVAPSHEGTAAAPAVTDLVPPPIATRSLAPVPVTTTHGNPAAPTGGRPGHRAVVRVAAVRLGAAPRGHTVHTVVATNAGPGGTNASGPAAHTPLPNRDTGTAVVVTPTPAGAPTSSAPGTPGRPVRSGGGGTGTATTPEPTPPTTQPGTHPTTTPTPAPDSVGAQPGRGNDGDDDGDDDDNGNDDDKGKGNGHGNGDANDHGEGNDHGDGGDED